MTMHLHLLVLVSSTAITDLSMWTTIGDVSRVLGICFLPFALEPPMTMYLAFVHPGLNAQMPGWVQNSKDSTELVSYEFPHQVESVKGRSMRENFV
ncbi:hypothetical protein BGZ60DRAFT_414608 [Tricladium varicosporioides]|nr:hypothetical protein BGZ60DRAFT_414608 [Hymenoscyphus varicosporioides]